MAYTNYPGPPDVKVSFQQTKSPTASPDTQYYPVFVGTGITSRNKPINKAGLHADVSAFPDVTLSFDLINDINTDLFDQTTFTFGQLIVTPNSGGADITLSPTTDYTITKDISFSSVDNLAYVTIHIINSSITSADIMYELNMTIANTDDDFDVRTVSGTDKFFSDGIFGPVVLEEDGNQFFNDIAIAADICFRLDVPTFYYLEVPRNYGSGATSADFETAIQKIYFNPNLYRIVPLTSDADVLTQLDQFISGIANPYDKRETVGFVSYDSTQIIDVTDINELVTKVGGLSSSLNNKRICNVFAGKSVSYTMNSQRYVLPQYFAAAAVAALDTNVGLVDPLSRRTIDIFDSIDGPRFRPTVWNQLARYGVLIIQKDNPDSAAFIRHQLTTAQSDTASEQEYSVVKNWDVVTKKIRDGLAGYSGESNIDTGYTERLNGTTATLIQTLIELGLAKNITTVTPWSLATNGDVTNLVTVLQLDPVYPANQLDVYIVV